MQPLRRHRFYEVAKLKISCRSSRCGGWSQCSGSCNASSEDERYAGASRAFSLLDEIDCSQKFTEDQHQKLEQMQRRAPQLYGGRLSQEGVQSMPSRSQQDHLRVEADRLHAQWQLEKEKAEI